MGALSLVGPALLVALFPVALLALFFSPSAGSTKPLALNAFILGLTSAFLAVSGLVRLVDVDHVFVPRVLELTACSLAAWIIIWLLPHIAPRPVSHRPPSASTSRVSFATTHPAYSTSNTTMAISGRETQSSFLPPMTSSVSILHHHGHTPAPRSFAFGRSFSRNNHRDRNFRNTRSLPSSFFSNLTLDALPWNIVFITHLLTIFLVVAAVISLITLLPLVVHYTPRSGGPSKPISVPPFLGPIFTLSLSLIIDGLIIAFIPLHLVHRSPSALKHTLALGFVESLGLGLEAYTLVERVVMGSVKSGERAGFVRDVIMVLWIGGVIMIGCLLRFDFTPTRASNAVEHLAGSAPIVPTSPSAAADLHRRRIEAYAPPSVHAPEPGGGTPTFIIGSTDDNEKAPDFTLPNKEATSPPSHTIPIPIPASDSTSSPGLKPGDPELSPLALKGSRRTRANSRDALAVGEIILPSSSGAVLDGIEPLVFGDPAEFALPRTRTVSFNESQKGKGKAGVRGRSASLGQIGALEGGSPSRIPRPVGSMSAKRARAVSAPLASASASSLNPRGPRIEADLMVPREIVSPSQSSPLGAEDAGKGKEKEDFVLDLQAMRDPEPPSPFLSGLGIGLAPASRRTSVATSHSPIPPRPSHPPPMSPRSTLAAGSPSPPAADPNPGIFENPRASPRPPVRSIPHPESPRLRNISLTNDTGALGWMSNVLNSVVRGAKDLIATGATAGGGDSLPLPVSSPAARASGVISAVASDRLSASPRGRSFVPSVFDSESDGSGQQGEEMRNDNMFNTHRGTDPGDSGDRLYLHPRRPTHSQSYASFHPPQSRNKQLRPSRSSVTVGMKASTALSLLSTSSHYPTNGRRASLLVSHPVPMPSPERKMGNAEPRKAPLPPASAPAPVMGGITVSEARKDATGRRPSALKLAGSASKTSPSMIPVATPPSKNFTPSSKGISSPPSSYPPTTPGMTATPTTGTHRTSHSASSTLSSAIDPVNYPVPPPLPAHLAGFFSVQSQRTLYSSTLSSTPASTSAGPDSENRPPRQRHHVRAHRHSPTNTHSRSVSIDMDDLKRVMLPLSPSDDFLVGLGDDPFASMPTTPLLMNTPTMGAQKEGGETEGYLGVGVGFTKSAATSPLGGAFFGDEAQSPEVPMSPGMIDVEKDLPGLPRHSLSTSASSHQPSVDLPLIPDEISSASASPVYHLKSKWSESTTADYAYIVEAPSTTPSEAHSVDGSGRRRSSRVTFAEPLILPGIPSPTRLRGRPPPATVMTHLKRSVSDPLAPVHAFMRSSMVLGSPGSSGSASPHVAPVNSSGAKWRRASAAAHTGSRPLASSVGNRAVDVRFLESIVRESLQPGVATVQEVKASPSRLPKRSPIPIFNLPSADSDMGSSEESFGSAGQIMPGLSIRGLLVPEGENDGDTTITPLTALVSDHPLDDDSVLHDRDLTPTPTLSAHPTLRMNQGEHNHPFSLTIPDSSTGGSLTPTARSPSLPHQQLLDEHTTRIPRPAFTNDAHKARARRAASLSPNASLSLSIGGARIRTSRRFPVLDPNWMSVNQRLDIAARERDNVALNEEGRKLKRHQSLDAKVGLRASGGPSVLREYANRSSRMSGTPLASALASPSSPLFHSADATEDFSMLMSTNEAALRTPPPREANHLTSKPLPATPPRLATRTISGTATPISSPGRLLPLSSAFQQTSAPPSPSDHSHQFSSSSPGGSPGSPGRKRARPGLTLNLDMTKLKTRTSMIPVASQPYEKIVFAAPQVAPVLMSNAPVEPSVRDRPKSNSVSTAATAPSTSGTFGQRYGTAAQGYVVHPFRDSTSVMRASQDTLPPSSAGSSSPRSFLPTLDSPTPSIEEEDHASEMGAFQGTEPYIFPPRVHTVPPRAESVGLGFPMPSRQVSTYVPGSRLQPPPLSPMPTVSDVESGQSIYYSALPTPTTPFTGQSPSSNASSTTLDRFSPFLTTPPPFANLLSRSSPSQSPAVGITNTKTLPLSIPEEAEDSLPNRSPSIAVGSMANALSPSLYMDSPAPSMRSERSRRSRVTSLFRNKSRLSKASAEGAVSTRRTGTVRSQASYSSDAAFELQEFGVRSPDGEDQVRRTPTLGFSAIGRSSGLREGSSFASSGPNNLDLDFDFAFDGLGLDFEV